MVISCAAYGCTNRWCRESKLQFHRFPLKKPVLLKQWLVATRRASWCPTKFSFLCSAHFTDDSYKSSKRRYLKDDAVPTIFNFTRRLKKTERKKQHMTVKRALQVSEKVCSDAESCSVLVSCSSPQRPLFSPSIVTVTSLSTSNTACTSAMVSTSSSAVKTCIDIDSIASNDVESMFLKSDHAQKSKGSLTKQKLHRKIKMLLQQLKCLIAKYQINRHC